MRVTSSRLALASGVPPKEDCGIGTSTSRSTSRLQRVMHPWEVYEHQCGFKRVPRLHQLDVTTSLVRLGGRTTSTKTRDAILAYLRHERGWSNNVGVCPGLRNT